MRTLLMLAGTLSLAQPVVAEAASGLVTAVHHDGTSVILSLDGAGSSAVPCNTKHGFAAGAASELGQAISQTMAVVAGSALTVTAIGAGTCTVRPGYEDLRSIRVSGAPAS